MKVRSFPPNAWGLFDMHGNVAEICSDEYAPYPSTSVIDPKNPSQRGSRIVRGGNFRTFLLGRLSCAARSHGISHGGEIRIGFRVVREE